MTSNIARTVSRLRPVRPHSPFYRLSAHRVPTLWVLYRGLLRASLSQIVRSHIQSLFRNSRHLTSPALTKILLERGYRWLDAFHNARHGDEHLRAVIDRFGRLIDARRANDRMRRIVNDYLSWNHRLLNRPIVTPTLFRPSIYNGPLPRLKPQPDHISGMIHKRRVARAQRVQRQRTLFSRVQDFQLEAQFEVSLASKGAQFTHFFSGLHLTEWLVPIKSHLEELHEAFQRDTERASRPTPPDLIYQLRAARREKIANKMRQREREARGEVLSATRRRSRLGFPAPVLARWTPEVRKANLLARRSVGVVGYVGHVKRKLGYNVPSKKGQEDEVAREDLDNLAEMIRRTNQSRRDSGARTMQTSKDGAGQGPREVTAA